MSVIWTLTRSSFCVGYEKIMRNLSSLHCVMNMRTLTGSQFRCFDKFGTFGRDRAYSNLHRSVHCNHSRWERVQDFARIVSTIDRATLLNFHVNTTFAWLWTTHCEYATDVKRARLKRQFCCYRRVQCLAFVPSESILSVEVRSTGICI